MKDLHRERKNIRPGLKVAVVLKHDQRTGWRTIGVVKDLLTRSSFHPHGIKVRLADGQVGRVQEILDDQT
ncbi:MAG: YwbE family protein [Pyrinomonadaceae bacterium]